MSSAPAPITPDPGGGADIRPVPPPARMRLDLYDNSAFDRGASRWKEALWMLCKCFFFLNPFPWPSSLRVALLRCFGARIGDQVVLRSGVNVTFPWRFSVGDHVWIGEDVLILSLAPVTLGSRICISQRAFLCTGSHAWRSEKFDLRTSPITVDDGVWISAQAFIGAGVRLGGGSVVSAGAVLTQSIAADTFARGNPAVVTPIASCKSDKEVTSQARI